MLIVQWVSSSKRVSLVGDAELLSVQPLAKKINIIIMKKTQSIFLKFIFLLFPAP